MKVKIEVTKEDIKNGTPQDAGKCPIALAAKRKVKNMGWVIADRLYIDGYPEGEEKFIDMPKKCEAFIDKFDMVKPVKPFSFTLNVPLEFIK